MGTIKQVVTAIINATPRLQADMFGNEWPAHSHAVHSGLDADDHLHYMTNAAGASRHHTGDVYFDERIMSDDNLRLDDHYRYLHADGGGDWDQEGIDLSAGAAEWQDLYDAAGGIVSLIAAITMGINSGGGPSGGGNLNYSYHYGASGTGRTIAADEGAVEITVADTNNSPVMVLHQNDVTNNPNILELRGTGPGHSLYMYGGAQDIYGEGALYLRSGGNVNLQPTANLTFDDGHRSGSTYTSAMPFSDNTAEWDAAYSILGGTGSLLALAMSGGGTLDDAYDHGGSGSGRSITVDSGSVALTVPGAGTDSALSLTNMNSANTSEVISLYNDATISTGYAIRIQGNAGGGTTDYQVMGHLIWAAGSMTVGHGDLSSGAGNSRSYSNYRYINDSGSYASATMVAEGEASWTTKGYVDVRVDSGGGEVNIYAGGTAGTASGTINLTAERYGAMTNADINLVSNDDILLDASELIIFEAGSAVSLRLYPTGGSGADIRFSDYYIFNNWTNQYIGLSDDSTESAQYTTDFGQVSIFEALHQCLSGGGSVSEPDTQIVWGTDTGVDSDSYLTYEDTAHVLTINGRLNLNNASWGTIGSASFSAGTITVNFSTGKDIQTVALTADATDLSITAPSGGAAKGLVLIVTNSQSTPYSIGGGNDWNDVDWEESGPDLSSDTVLIPGTGTNPDACVVITFVYNGSILRGWVSEFHGEAV